MRPPAFARWCLRLVAPATERDELLADLDEEFARRVSSGVTTRARGWYRRQVRASMLPLAGRRVSAWSPRRVAAGGVTDLRASMRALAQTPRFTISVILLLAVGIGSHTVVYAVVDALVLRPLPFGERSERLITLHATHPTLAQDWDDSGVSYPDLIDLRRSAASLEALEAAVERNVSVATGTAAERVSAASITPGLLPMLGVQPVIGRGFKAEDAAEPGFEQVMLLGHGLWRSLFDGDPGVVGRTLLMNGRALVVVGVMPPGFTFPDEHQLWLPYRGPEIEGRQNRGLLAIGLLRPGVDLGSGLADMKSVAAELARRHPDTNRDWSVHAFPIREYFVDGTDAEQLLAAVSLLLIVACANVAGLVLARGAARRREIAVRAALGAARRRLFGLLGLESVLLAAVGGVLGLVFAQWGIRLLMAWIPEPPPYWAQPALDLRVAAAAILITGAVGLAAGLLPALRLSKVRGAEVLSGTRLTGSRGFNRTQRTLVVGQVALSLVLLVSAVLLGRSAMALLTADPGFDRHPLFSARFYMAGDRYDSVPIRAAAVADVVAEVSKIPGVTGVTATSSIPSDDGGGPVRIVAPGSGAGEDQEFGGQVVTVSPGFWQALGLELDAGRTFTDAEYVDPDAPVAIINRRLADRLWPGASAVDHDIVLNASAGRLVLRVVGVAPDLVYEEFTEETAQSRLNLYVPFARAAGRTQALLIRTAVDPASVDTAVRTAVRRVDSGFAVYDSLTMDARREYNHWGDQFMGRVFWTLGLAALLLACVGAYALASYAVERRRREVGVRLAVGATAGQIVRLFATSGGRLAALGVAFGLPPAWLIARALEADLFRTPVWTADVWLWPPVALVVAVVLASYVPARRAARTDPASVLSEN